jgi:MoaA/NifB/PqqE/SkfB family radical SAM enzyme
MAIQSPFDFLIQWHLTERCNLSCRHCYQTERCTEELALADIRRGIEEIAEMFDAWAGFYAVSFAPSFNITGGEPLLRGDLFEILSELRRRGYESFLLTNGTLVDRERARLLADFDVKGVQVSIEGCEDIHDSIRGAGSFARSADGVEHLLDAGLKVTLNVTLSRLNAKSLKKVVLFASHLGVQRVGFSRLVPAGRGGSLAAEMLSAQEVKELYESIFALDIRNLDIVTGDPVASQFRSATRVSKKKKKGGEAPFGGCAAGVSGLTFLPDGTIVPCRRMPVPIGNLKTDSLRELWAASPVLEALRDRSRYTGKCGACSRWESCRGCRAIAYAYAKSRGEDDFLAEDPQCFLD